MKFKEQEGREQVVGRMEEGRERDEEVSISFAEAKKMKACIG